MMREMKILLIGLLFIFQMGCASSDKTTFSSPPSHPHYYPFTADLAETYHVRLAVSHEKGEAALVFEDIREQPIKIVRLSYIKGRAKLPDRIIKEANFRAVDAYHKNHWTNRRASILRSKKRLVGIFAARAEWLKTTPKFDLQVEIPFEGKTYNLTFNYEVQGGKIPKHRK